MISYYTAIVTATWQSCSLLEVFSLLSFCTDPPERRIKYGPRGENTLHDTRRPKWPFAWLLLRRTKKDAVNGAPWAWASSHLPCSQSSAVPLQIGFLGGEKSNSLWRRNEVAISQHDWESTRAGVGVFLSKGDCHTSPKSRVTELLQCLTYSCFIIARYF